MATLRGRYAVSYKGRAKKLKIDIAGEGIFQQLEEVIFDEYKISSAVRLQIEYRDENGDYILLESDQELTDAIRELEALGCSIRFRASQKMEEDEFQDGKDPLTWNQEMHNLARNPQSNPDLGDMVGLPPSFKRYCSWPVIGVASCLLITFVTITASTASAPQGTTERSAAQSDIDKPFFYKEPNPPSMYPTFDSFTPPPTSMPEEEKGGKSPDTKASQGEGGSVTPTRHPSSKEKILTHQPTLHPTFGPSTGYPTHPPTEPLPTRKPTVLVSKPPSPTYKPVTSHPIKSPKFEPDWRIGAPYLDPERPIMNITDVRYGRFEPSHFSEERLKFWEKCAQHRHSEQQFKKKHYGTFGPGYVNLWTWDGQRKVFCDYINKEKSISYPDMYVWKPNDLSGGFPKSTLDFDPTVIKRHALQFRGYLSEYYEGGHNLKNRVIPLMNENNPREGGKGYAEGMDVLAENLLRKFVHKEKFVIGVLGTSVVAAMDNCFKYAYPNQLLRILKPLFNVANVEMEVRTSGQNGDGPPVPPQTRCMASILGPMTEVDIVQFGWWMIGVSTNVYIEQTRRLLADGVLPHYTSGYLLGQPRKSDPTTEELYKLGLMEIVDGDWASAGGPDSVWWPTRHLSRNHWGRHGDGHCHMETREGADGVAYYNWHPGPMGFQKMADIWAYRYSGAIILAMEKLESMIKSNIDPKKSVPQSRPKAKKLPKHPSCSREHPLPADMELCSGELDKGYSGVTCGLGHHPQWGDNSNLTSFAVNVAGDGKPLAKVEKYSGDWKYVNIPGTRPSSCGLALRGENGVRPHPECGTDKECEHPDAKMALRGLPKSGWIGFKYPKPLQRGLIAICNKNKGEGMTKAGALDLSILVDGNPITLNYKEQFVETCAKYVDEKLIGKTPTLSLKVGKGVMDLWAVIGE